MSEIPKKIIFAVISLIMILAICALCFYAQPLVMRLTGSGQCTLPPEDFSEIDLEGVWQATRLPDRDTLIIRGDGTYKQVIHKENLDYEGSEFNYESEWLTWYMESTESGYFYLHMEGLRLCAGILRRDCEIVGGGERKWYDPCRGQYIPMENKGVLVVLGDKSYLNRPPRGIQLMLLTSSSEHSWGYELINTTPQVP